MRKDKNPYFKKIVEHIKYTTLCEGDDYWVDPDKLQKQFNIMESQPNVGLCYTDADSYIQDLHKHRMSSGCHFYEGVKALIKRNPVMTPTTFYKTCLYDAFLDEIRPKEKGWLAGDYPLWIWIAMHSEIKYIDEVTAVYRVLNNSASHSTEVNRQIKMYLSDYEIRKFFLAKYFPNDENLRIEIEDNMNRQVAGVYQRIGNTDAILAHYKAIVRKTPKEIIKIVLYSIGLYKVVRYLRK